MINNIKRVIPKKFKNYIKKFIINQVGESRLNNIDILINIVYDLSPPLIVINEKTKRTINNFKRKYNISDNLNTNISKNDMMYFYMLYFCKGNLQKTYYDYLETGLNSYNIIKKIADHHFGALENVNSILDYASGYGRLTRFLILNYPKEKIWISDIKEFANEFQKEQFGVNTVISNFSPDEFNPNISYDIIFVGSLFTHLPQELFKKWLLKFYNLLTDSGILILSTHDITLYNGKVKEEFIYTEDSEELLLSGFVDSIEDKSVYGSTYISENMFKQFLLKVGINVSNYFRYPKILYYGQDIYVISKKETKFNDKIEFDILKRL